MVRNYNDQVRMTTSLYDIIISKQAEMS